MDKFRLWATINTLRKVSKEYPDKTIENVIAQLEARREEMKLEIVSQDNKKNTL